MSFHAPRDPQPNTEPPTTAAVELEALPALLTVAEGAEILRVARSWVYEHAAELGAFGSVMDPMPDWVRRRQDRAMEREQ